MDSPSPKAAECPWPLLTDSSESNGSSSSCSNSDDYSGPSLCQPWITSNQEDVGESGLTSVNPLDLMLAKQSSGEVAANHGSPPKPKTQECSICGLVFAKGQALGSHKRRRHMAAINENMLNSTTMNDCGLSSLEAHQHSALQCRGSHVKLRIESFRVPELFVEIPETATIGSLKRTVMDSVTAVLGSGLRDGVILQGKKVIDDSKTLLQTGISLDNQLDALGFTLEPNSSQSLLPVCAAHSPLIPSADIPHPSNRYPSSPAVINQRIQGGFDMWPKHQVTSLGNLVESDHDSVPSPINTSADKTMTDSKALDTVPAMSGEELPMACVLQKSKRSEIVQRRIRKRFSVDELEALVQAVEKLGTGRWRDVKLCAFDNAKHWTYVDMKAKWITLVHMAKISPQQRRGGPVPQELLDRVLATHAYWSYQQTKQQVKQHSETCLLL